MLCKHKLNLKNTWISVGLNPICLPINKETWHVKNSLPSHLGLPVLSMSFQTADFTIPQSLLIFQILFESWNISTSDLEFGHNHYSGAGDSRGLWKTTWKMLRGYRILESLLSPDCLQENISTELHPKSNLLTCSSTHSMSTWLRTSWLGFSAKTATLFLRNWSWRNINRNTSDCWGVFTNSRFWITQHVNVNGNVMFDFHYYEMQAWRSWCCHVSLRVIGFERGRWLKENFVLSKCFFFSFDFFTDEVQNLFLRQFIQIKPVLICFFYVLLHSIDN